MRNFSYCIWLLPEDIKWNNYTNGFIFHMTIKHSLSLSEAINIYNKLECSPISMNLSEKYTLSYDNNFNALYYILKKNINIPNYFPNECHVSLFYKYNYKISDKEKKKIKKLSNTVFFDKLALVDCNKKHFKNWRIISYKNLN